MHGPINVKSHNISKWQMGFNSAFKRLTVTHLNITLSYRGHDVFLNELCVISFVHKFFLTYR
jgi:hypothetical protein